MSSKNNLNPLTAKDFEIGSEFYGVRHSNPNSTIKQRVITIGQYPPQIEREAVIINDNYIIHRDNNGKYHSDSFFKNVEDLKATLACKEEARHEETLLKIKEVESYIREV